MEKRLEWNDELFLKLCKKVALDLQKWEPNELTLEGYTELCKKVLKFNLNEDGFQLAKIFEEEGLDSNPELVEILERVFCKKYNILKEETALWVVKNNLSLKYLIGDKVLYTCSKGKEEEYEIVGLYQETLQYGIWNKNLKYEKGRGSRVVVEEKLNPVEL